MEIKCNNFYDKEGEGFFNMFNNDWLKNIPDIDWLFFMFSEGCKIQNNKTNDNFTKVINYKMRRVDRMAILQFKRQLAKSNWCIIAKRTAIGAW